MAVNEARSMNNDLKEGANDGKFKSLTPDRGGVAEEMEPMKRAQIVQPQYGIVERTPLANTPEAYLHR